MYLKHWLTREEYAALDETMREHYIAHGDEYQLKPNPREMHQQKISMFVLAALALSFSAVGTYGIAVDSLQLQILGFCGAMPTAFGFLINLAMYMGWS